MEDLPMISVMTNSTIDQTMDVESAAPGRHTGRPMIAVLVAALLGFALMSCTSGEASSNASAINTVRAAAGLPELVRSPELDAKAEAQADRMAKRGGIYHSKNLTSGVTGGWSGIAENVAMAGSVEQAQAALEASPGHYANMTNPSYNQVGIGAVTRNGVVYLVQVFVSR
jgi:uncharacterized protein YkwD